MAGHWQQGTELELKESRVMVCVDGELWEIRDADGYLLGVLNPTAAVSCRELIEELDGLLKTEPAIGREYGQLSVSD